MKLIIQDNRIAATATDDYTGPDLHITAPEELDLQRLGEYRMVDGALIIPVPMIVTMRQARLALLGAGLLQQVKDQMALMQGDTGEAARIEWEYGTEVRRDSHLVSSLSDSLGLSAAQLDALFEQAAKL